MSGTVTIEMPEDEAMALAAMAIAYAAENPQDGLRAVVLAGAARLHLAFCAHPERCRMHAVIESMVMAGRSCDPSLN